MKRANRKGIDEGWLLAVILCAILAVCAAVYMDRLPRKTTAEPVHVVLHPLAPAASDLVDINRADTRQLAKLPGIGEILAERIVDYREANGLFGAPEELLLVEGIGEKKLAELMDSISCQIP